MKAALISEWDNSISGISSYSKWLWTELKTYFDETVVFSRPSKIEPQEEGVIRCWEHHSSVKIFEAIEKFNPDVIYFQKAGFASAQLSSFLKNWHTISTVHDINAKYDVVGYGFENNFNGSIYWPCKKIVVHSAEAKKELENAWGKTCVNLIPHGSLSPTPSSIYRKTNSIVQFGAGKTYKKYDNAIRIAKELKSRFAYTEYTGLFGCFLQKFMVEDQSKLHKQLEQFASDIGASDYTKIIPGNHSESFIDSYLYSHSVALFPYSTNRVYATSGAARYAMSRQIPVVTSSSHLFDDLEGICPRPSTIEGWAEAIEILFDPTEAKKQVEKQNNLLEQTSWKKVAKMYADLAYNK